MEVLDCMELEVDQYASLDFSVFVGCAGVDDVECASVDMAAGMEHVVDTEDILDL